MQALVLLGLGVVGRLVDDQLLARCFLTLPASADGDLGGDVGCRVKRPVVNDLRIVSLVNPLVTVHGQLDFGEVDVDCVVMPLVVTDLVSWVVLFKAFLILFDILTVEYS